MSRKPPRVVPTLSSPAAPSNPPVIIEPAVTFTKGFTIPPWKDRASKVRRRKIRSWRLGRGA